MSEGWSGLAWRGVEYATKAGIIYHVVPSRRKFSSFAFFNISCVMALPPKWYQFLVCVFASLGSALYGYDLGVIAGAVNSKNFTRVFSPEANEVGAVVSVFTGGAFFGAAFAGPTARLDRTKEDYFHRSCGLHLGWRVADGCAESRVPLCWKTYVNGLSLAMSELTRNVVIAGLGVGALVMIIPP